MAVVSQRKRKRAQQSFNWERSQGGPVQNIKDRSKKIILIIKKEIKRERKKKKRGKENPNRNPKLHSPPAL